MQQCSVCIPRCQLCHGAQLWRCSRCCWQRRAMRLVPYLSRWSVVGACCHSTLQLRWEPCQRPCAPFGPAGWHAPHSMRLTLLSLSALRVYTLNALQCQTFGLSRSGARRQRHWWRCGGLSPQGVCAASSAPPAPWRCPATSRWHCFGPFYTVTGIWASLRSHQGRSMSLWPAELMQQLHCRYGWPHCTLGDARQVHLLPTGRVACRRSCRWRCCAG